MPTVLQYLDKNFGKVQSEEVKQKEAEVLSLSFNPADPMFTLYCPIEQLQKLTTAAGIPYLEAQKLEICLTLIHGTRDFEKSLREWNSRIATTKTWDTFKVHFKAAQIELKEIRGPTMQQAGYHHTNMLADQLRADLQIQGTEMLALVQSMVIDDNQPKKCNLHHSLNQNLRQTPSCKTTCRLISYAFSATSPNRMGIIVDVVKTDKKIEVEERVVTIAIIVLQTMQILFVI